MSWLDSVGQTVGGLWNTVANVIAPIADENNPSGTHSVSNYVYI
jgi:hypothetical protein